MALHFRFGIGGVAPPLSKLVHLQPSSADRDRRGRALTKLALAASIPLSNRPGAILSSPSRELSSRFYGCPWIVVVVLDPALPVCYW